MNATIIWDWLLADWRQLAPAPWIYVALTAAAVLCGALVGMEREKKEKPAGILTLTLVSLGAAVFTMVSFAFTDGEASARIAGQIVTGIGFLGGGVILRGSGGVRGTVTAATIWVSAAMGMVVGIGYAGAALGLSLVILSVLIVVSRIDRRLIEGGRHTSVRVVFDPAGGKTLVRIEEAIDINEVHAKPTDVRPINSNLAELRFNYCPAHRNHREFLAQLAQFPEVKEIHRGER